MNITPTVVFGDIHGLTCWKDIIKEHPDCRYVFLGDYLDPYKYVDNTALVDNLKEIIQLKKTHPDEVVLLLGNHDLHYFSTDIVHSTRFNFGIAKEVSSLFLSHIHLFQYAFQEEHCVFTHAGIAHQWFVDDFKGDLERNIADQLNNPRPEQIDALCRCGYRRGGTFGAIGGIFWADVEELFEPLQGYTQIVGHNRVKDIVDHVNNNGRIIFCDCLFNRHYLKI
ncbi:MAG: metallophosphoesterase [Tannerellaceae bacterium]|nr:metallophosphoesterase [Tannerellaceae bacterium]